MPEPIPETIGLSQLAPRYDALLCDIWGVVHNGIVPHAGAPEALAAFRAGGGVVVLITNAPYPSPSIIGGLEAMGVSSDSYDAVVSSGDVTRNLLAAYAGQPVQHAGPRDLDAVLLDGLDIILVPAGAPAAAVVISDLEADNDTVADYADRMTGWLAAQLPLICAKPDKVVDVGVRLLFWGGAVADAYADLGGTVIFAGKPYPEIYAEALRLAEAAAGRKLSTDRILAIGDSVRTDATGAARMGLDLLFVTGSIHAADLGAAGHDPAAVAGLVAPSGARMVGFMAHLGW